jgi:1,2-diacylglycerol 3-alpha-glucosyltransferase
MIGSGKHILILTPGFAADEEDKTCIPALQNYINAYAKRFSEDKITILAVQYPFKKLRYNWNNIDVYAIGGSNRSFPFRLFTWKYLIDTFKEIHKRQNVDILHAFWLNECSLIGNYLASRHKIKFLVTAMGQDCSVKNSYLKLLNLRKIYTVCLSDFQQKELQEITTKKCEQVIPFGIPVVDHLEPKIRNIDILGVGSVVRVKNYTTFVKIIARLKNEFPEIKVRIIGNQPSQKELRKVEKLIRENKVEQNLILTGQINPEEVLEYMQQSKILLHTSSFEGQGMVFSEALSSGMYVICFKTGKESPEKMIVCNHSDEIINELCKLLLKQDLDFNPIPQLSIMKTASTYNQLYHQL